MGLQGWRFSSMAALVAAVLLTAGSLLAAPQDSPRPPRPPKAMGAAHTWTVAPEAGGSFLGVHVREVDSERAEQKSLPEVRGVEITKVVAGSAADKAGIEVGDVVLDYHGERVEGVEQFVRLVRETPVGRRVAMKVFREGEKHDIEVTMGVHGKGFAFKSGRSVVVPRFSPPEIVIPDVPHVYTTWRSAKLGIVGESLESQLAEYFKVKEGVLVRSVSEDSPAAKADLRAGDVITRVGDTPVATPREVSAAISEHEGDTAELTIVRDRKQQRISVPLGCCSGGRGSNIQQRFVLADPVHM